MDQPAPEMLRTDLCAFVGPHGRCMRTPDCKGWCKPHYEQQRKGQEMRTLKDALPTECRLCGGPVYIKVQQLCHKCFDSERRRVVRDDRECANCGSVFAPKRSDHWCCTYKCSMENARLKHNYGITGSELNALLVAQDGKCWTCKRPVQRGGDDRALLFHIDHDHACCPSAKSCGKCLRKLLCFNCNAALGQIGDSAEVAYALGDYLTLFHAERVERLGKPVGEFLDLG